MKKVGSYCALLCEECSIFKATLEDDDEKRAEIAATMSELYDKPFKPEHINCDGCTVKDGRLFIFARKCSVRNREIQKRSD